MVQTNNFPFFCVKIKGGILCIIVNRNHRNYQNHQRAKDSRRTINSINSMDSIVDYTQEAGMMDNYGHLLPIMATNY